MAALDKLADTADVLIEKFGKLVTFHVPQDRAYDPVTMQTTESGVAAYQVKASPPSPFDKSRSQLSNDIDASLTTYIAAKGLPFTVKTGIRIGIDGEELELVGFSPIYSGELIAAYELGMKA